MVPLRRMELGFLIGSMNEGLSLILIGVKNNFEAEKYIFLTIYKYLTINI
jgi:hypothetical protein